MKCDQKLLPYFYNKFLANIAAFFAIKITDFFFLQCSYNAWLIWCSHFNMLFSKIRYQEQPMLLQSNISILLICLLQIKDCTAKRHVNHQGLFFNQSDDKRHVVKRCIKSKTSAISARATNKNWHETVHLWLKQPIEVKCCGNLHTSLKQSRDQTLSTNQSSGP